MAKAKKSAKKAPAKKAAKKVAAPKKSDAPLAKSAKKRYTKGQLVAHLAAAVANEGLGEISKKQVACVLDELSETLFRFAALGSVIPGVGKVVLKTIPAKPARTMVSFGKEIKVSAKPKSQKLVFRFSKDAKARYAK
jgi:hypothetical protein